MDLGVWVGCIEVLSVVIDIYGTHKVVIICCTVLIVFPQKVLCQLATEEDDAAAQTFMKHTGVAPKEYHLKVLRKVLALYCCFPYSFLHET